MYTSFIYNILIKVHIKDSNDNTLTMTPMKST